MYNILKLMGKIFSIRHSTQQNTVIDNNYGYVGFLNFQSLTKQSHTEAWVSYTWFILGQAICTSIYINFIDYGQATTLCALPWDF